MSLKPMPPLSSLLTDREWVEMWQLCVRTRNEQEESWAFGKLKAAYLRVMGDMPLDPVRGLPSGMWEAMSETAISEQSSA